MRRFRLCLQSISESRLFCVVRKLKTARQVFVLKPRDQSRGRFRARKHQSTMFPINKAVIHGLMIIFLIHQVAGHFLLHTPETIGFDDDNEGIPPCGGFKVTFDKTSDWHVGGDVISLTSTHPKADWLFRSTLDKTACGNWTDLSPIVSQTGLGSYCEPSLSVPSDWAGSSGIVQIVQNAADGTLFQVCDSSSTHRLSQNNVANDKFASSVQQSTMCPGRRPRCLPRART